MFPNCRLFNSHLDKEGHRIAGLTTPRRFQFVLDVSASMKGEKIELAKQVRVVTFPILDS